MADYRQGRKGFKRKKVKEVESYGWEVVEDNKGKRGNFHLSVKFGETAFF